MTDLGACSEREWTLALPGLKRPDAASLDLSPMREYEKATAKARASKHLPGCCSIAIAGDQVLQVGGFGFADLEHGARMTTGSIVRLYCLTKPMIATALMILVERGACRLEDDVSKYLPEFSAARVCARPGSLRTTQGDPSPRSKLSLRRLLTHSSGLGYGPVLGMDPAGPGEAAYKHIVKDCDAGRITSLRALCRELAKLPLRFHPGKRYMYSYGLDVVGRVIEVISRKRLDRFLKDELFGPLGMRDTGFAVPGPVAKRRLAALYASLHNKKSMGERVSASDTRHKTVLGALMRVDGSRPGQSAWVKGRSCPVLSGGGIMGENRGGLVSTLADQTRFYMALLRGGQLSPGHRRLLRPETVEGMWGTDWLTRPDVVGKACYEARKRFGWHALGEIGVVKRPGLYPDSWEVGEWGMAGAACTHVVVNPKRQTLCMWFTQTLEGWPGWRTKEQSLWVAVERVLRGARGGKRRGAGALRPGKRARR